MSKSPQVRLAIAFANSRRSVTTPLIFSERKGSELLRKYAELDLAHLLDLYRQNPNRGNRLLFEERTALRDCLADLKEREK